MSDLAHLLPLWLSLWGVNPGTPPDLYPQFPPLSCLARFPDREEAHRQACLYQRHVNYLTLCYDNYSGPMRKQIGEWIWESERAKSTWELLRDVYWSEPEPQRRRVLDNLRRTLGDEAFSLGRMPAPFPVGYEQPGAGEHEP